jgi:hypothetical protein
MNPNWPIHVLVQMKEADGKGTWATAPERELGPELDVLHRIKGECVNDVGRRRGRVNECFSGSPLRPLSQCLELESHRAAEAQTCRRYPSARSGRNQAQ